MRAGFNLLLMVSPFLSDVYDIHDTVVILIKTGAHLVMAPHSWAQEPHSSIPPHDPHP